MYFIIGITGTFTDDFNSLASSLLVKIKSASLPLAPDKSVFSTSPSTSKFLKAFSALIFKIMLEPTPNPQTANTFILCSFFY